MLSTEIRINGVLIEHIYVINKWYIKDDLYKYEYEYYKVCGKLCNGTINHSRKDGSLVLLGKIISKISKEK